MFNHLQFERLEYLLSKMNSPNFELKSFFFDAKRPQKIYRYRKFDSFWKSNLFNGEIFLASLDTLNDPYEGRWALDFDDYIRINIYNEAINDFDKIVLKQKTVNNEELFAIIFCIIAYSEDDILEKEYGISKQEIVKNLGIDEFLFYQLISNYKNEIKRKTIERQKIVEEQMRENVCIACFTEDNTNNLMWSHYADSHRGFCIEYDLTRIKQDDKKAIVPVIYTDKRFHASIKNYPQLEYYHWIPLLIKGDEWAYEKEWRIFTPFKPQTQLITNYKDAISGIYLGYNASKYFQNEINEIKKWASNLNIPVYLEEFSQSDFQIQFCKYP